MISIEKGISGRFRVSVDTRVAEELTYDEMLGLVSQLTIPENKNCLQWLRSSLIEEAKERGYLDAHWIVPAHVDFCQEAAIFLPTEKSIDEVGEYLVLRDYKGEMILGENTLSAVIYHNGNWAKIIK